MSISRALWIVNNAVAAIVFVSVAVVFSGSTSFGGERVAPEMIESGASCIDAGCHQDLTVGPTVHKPIATDKDSCEMCHESDGNRHAFSFPSEEREMCYGCHDSVTKDEFVHFPLKEKANPCTTCHDPHVSATKHLLRAPSAEALCLRCHSDMAEGELYHRSPAAGGCVACHEPHSSDSPKLLRASPPDLCYTCHEDLKEKVSTARVVHGPLNTGCTACHNPHQAMAGQRLAEKGAALCIRCHADFKATLERMQAAHETPLEKDACGRCHDPHASGQEQLLRSTSSALCLTCHAKSIQRNDGSVIKGLATEMVEGAELHGPLARRNCAGCHEPHANTRFRFLRDAYPPTLYGSYSADAYALCFACHGDSLAQAADTTNATNFRNGTVNLHYLHVNKKRKGRTCRACHAPHASKNPHFLRDAVPFGEWEIPINFTGTENGGTCDSGCHQSKSYDRVHPVSSGNAPASAPVSDAKE